MQTVVMFDTVGEAQRQYIFLYPEDDCGPLCQLNCLMWAFSHPADMQDLMDHLEDDMLNYGPLGYTFTCYPLSKEDYYECLPE